MAETKYKHKKGLDRQELRNFPRALRPKVRALILGKSISLLEEEKELLKGFINPVINQPKKIKENKDGNK
tara:strand:- start:35930 stop:36139 length:210 start_codon:yes stop_codon:yes gene_type:complete